MSMQRQRLCLKAQQNKQRSPWEAEASPSGLRSSRTWVQPHFGVREGSASRHCPRLSRHAIDSGFPSYNCEASLFQTEYFTPDRVSHVGFSNCAKPL